MFRYAPDFKELTRAASSTEVIPLITMVLDIDTLTESELRDLNHRIVERCAS